MLIALFTPVCAESVSKLIYNGQPEDLNGTTVEAPHGMVAMTEQVQVGIPGALTEGNPTGGEPSIFFVLDNSGSMWADGHDMDDHAYRYKVTSALIDSIKARNPKAEVGIGIFGSELYMKKSDDKDLFDVVNSGDEWGYIPLLNLSEEYPSERAGTGTGVEILKHYLKTRTTTTKNPLDYRPSGAEVGTNITCGFDGAVSAFKKAANPANRHYVIFISDGDANVPTDNDAERERFMQGIDVPTTFTIFFSKMDTETDNGIDTLIIPQSIPTMTNNINTNNGNQDSKYWAYQNNSEDELMTFLMDNVISVIDQKIAAEVKNLKINGTTGGSSWDGEFITFTDMFPLTGITTPFEYSIDYYIEDTTIVNGVETINLIDTTLNTNFSVELKDNVTDLPEKFTKESWERSLGFFDGNQALSVISATSQNTEIRFTEEAINIFYGYNDVDVEIKSKMKGDTEVLRLNKNSNVFTHGIDIDNSGAIAVDGRIQVDMVDTLIATFRNPKLPLDTIQIEVPYDVGTLLTLNSATYYDNNADGFIDSIFIGFQIENALSVDEVEELFALLANNIAPDRNFSFLTREWVNNGLGIKVVENSATPQTAIVEGDTISLGEAILASGGLTYQSKVTVTDGVAPIILSGGAVYNDLPNKQDDRLIIQFSEDIQNNTNTGQYFEFRRGADVYTASLTPESFNGSTGTFMVNSLSIDYMAEGDSLNIHFEKGMITDLAGVTQTNENNVERRLRVVSTISMGDVIFFDTSADGYIDKVTIDLIAGEGAELKIEDLQPRILLPTNRRLLVESAEINGGTVTMIVDGTNGNINTAVSDDDFVTILAGDIGMTNIPTDITKKAIDKMAPVIMPGGAVLRDLPETVNDTLTITYSEPVLESGQSGRYIEFRRGAAPYTAHLAPLATNGNVVQYAINSLLDVTSMIAGDSLRIEDGFSLVADYEGNPQINPENVERELQVLTTIGVSNATYFDNSGDGYIDSITLTIDAGEGVALDAAALQGQIKLPDNRFISINSSKFEGSEFQMLVTETGDLPRTAVSDEDKITLLAGSVGTAKIDNNITISVVDSMAPVIIRDGAVLYDYPSTEDTLEITFSEPVEKSNRAASEYFIFRSGNSPYKVFLTPTETSANTVRFSVNNVVTDYMRDGDSLRINSEIGLIKDIAHGVIQRNANNSEERLRVISTIEIGEAKYFDVNADGFVDSITIAVQAGDGVTLSGNDLIGQIELPSYRNFNVLSSTLADGELAIIVTENRQVPNTAVSNSDSIIVAKGTLQGAMIPETRVIGAQDFMAPVILQDGATMVDYANAPDSLVISFSEPIADIPGSGELFDIRRGDKVYKLFLEPVAVSDNEALFAVTFVNMDNIDAPKHMMSGDSLRIKPDRQLIKDLNGFDQRNGLNIERRLKVIADISPVEAAYFDENADGFVDIIRITFEAGDAINEVNTSELADAFEFNEDRIFTINGSQFDGATLVLNVTEGSEKPSTAIADKDRVKLPNDVNIDGGLVSNEKSIAVLDSLAPVIMPLGAVLHDSLSGTDLLTVEFSEKVTVTADPEKSLLFTAGDLILKKDSQDGNKFTFIIEGDYESFGDDSVWINHAVTGAVVDENGLNQTNEANIRRPLEVITYINPYELTVNAVTPYLQGVEVIPDERLNLPEFNLTGGENGGITGLTMQARAVLTGSDVSLDGIILEGEVTIIDPLGNTILPRTPMVFDIDHNDLIYVWNGRNQAGRKVSNGTYAARFSIRAVTADGSYSKEYGQTVMLGVQDKVPGAAK